MIGISINLANLAQFDQETKRARADETGHAHHQQQREIKYKKSADKLERVKWPMQLTCFNIRPINRNV